MQKYVATGQSDGQPATSAQVIAVDCSESIILITIYESCALVEC